MKLKNGDHVGWGKDVHERLAPKIFLTRVRSRGAKPKISGVGFRVLRRHVWIAPNWWRRDVAKTQVVNIRTSNFDVLIDRRSIFGNPFRLDRDGTRDQVCDKHEAWFLDRIATDEGFRRAVLRLRGKRLGCWCAPERCHGDTIAKWLEGS